MTDQSSSAGAYRPLVSVVLPTFRRPLFLERAIESVLNQSYTNLELIVVDDNPSGSSEQRETERVVAPYRDVSRVRYLQHRENKGGSASRNTGVLASSGELVAFLDDDDEWLPAKLARQVALFEGAPEELGLVYCGFIRQNDKTGERRVESPKLAGSLLFPLLEDNHVGSTSLVLCRRSSLDKVGGFDERLPSKQDVDLYVRLAHDHTIEFVPEPLVIRHTHGEPSIGKSFESAVAAQRIFFEKYRDLIESDRNTLHHRLKFDGRLLLDAGRPAQARELLGRSLRMRPFDALVLLWISLTFFDQRLVGPNSGFRRTGTNLRKRLSGMLRQ